jgi:peptide chain release factor
MNKEIIIQITSGRGPAECCWVVAQILKYMLEEAESKGLKTEILDRCQGMEAGTLQSALLLVEGEESALFCRSWEGSVLWIGQSPYRKYHKRKNWFVGVNVLRFPKSLQWNDNDVSFQTLKASGPGGQHVNKTESAVRATHNPSGLWVVARDNRSQLQNKKAAITRLKIKVMEWRNEQFESDEKLQWQFHEKLERGNPVRTFKDRKFVPV